MHSRLCNPQVSGCPAGSVAPMIRIMKQRSVETQFGVLTVVEADQNSIYADHLLRVFLVQGSPLISFALRTKVDNRI